MNDPVSLKCATQPPQKALSAPLSPLKVSSFCPKHSATLLALDGTVYIPATPACPLASVKNLSAPAWRLSRDGDLGKLVHPHLDQRSPSLCPKRTCHIPTSLRGSCSPAVSTNPTRTPPDRASIRARDVQLHHCVTLRRPVQSQVYRPKLFPSQQRLCLGSSPCSLLEP